MRLKLGAKINGVQPEMLWCMMIIEPILDEYNQELILTSITDGEHSSKSRHYIGYAIDIRTWQLKQDQKTGECATRMQDALGKEFYVHVEDTHIHIQFNGLPRR